MSVVNFVLGLVLVYLLWTLTIRLGLKKLSCWRSFSRSSFFEGESGELVEVVRNDTFFLIPWLRVETCISPHLRLGRQDNLQVSGEMYYCSFFSLMPHQQIRRRHRVTFLKRGAYDLGNAALTSGDILGAFTFMGSQKLSTPVLVYPRLMDPEELPMPVSRHLGELVRRQQLLSDPFLIRGIRGYQPGDPVRDIHWPATARTGETQVRVHDHTAQTKLMVVLNVQRKEGQWGDHLMEYEQGEIEHEISMAATLCIRALRAGLAAGFAANMPRGEEKGCTVLPPAGGAAREEELLTAFARLTILRSLSFPTFLETLTDHTGLDILVLSCYDSDEIQTALTKLRRSGNQVELYLLKGGAA